MTIHIFFGLVSIIVALIMLGLPNRFYDTTSCKQNWIVVLFILIGGSLLIENNMMTLILSSILISGILTNYILQFLLNTLSVLNRKSDP